MSQTETQGTQVPLPRTCSSAAGSEAGLCLGFWPWGSLQGPSLWSSMRHSDRRNTSGDPRRWTDRGRARLVSQRGFRAALLTLLCHRRRSPGSISNRKVRPMSAPDRRGSDHGRLRTWSPGCCCAQTPRRTRACSDTLQSLKVRNKQPVLSQRWEDEAYKTPLLYHFNRHFLSVYRASQNQTLSEALEEQRRHGPGASQKASWG